MTSPYKRRRPALLRNLWVYRQLVAAAVVLGVMLWFILINGTAVSVAFPFGLGKIQSTAGPFDPAERRGRLLADRADRGDLPGDPDGSGAPAAVTLGTTTTTPLPAIPDDRPPTDYAAKTTEGFSGTPWSSH